LTLPARANYGSFQQPMIAPKDSLEVLRRTLSHWKLIVACVFVIAGLATALAFIQPKKYTSTMQLFVSTQGAAATADALASDYSGSQFTTARVQSYVDLVSSPEISVPVIKMLGLKMTRDEFDNEVSVNAPLNTVLLNVVVSDRSPSRAQRIATAVGREYIKVIHKLETPPGQASPVRVSVSSPAVLPTQPSSPDKTQDIALGVIFGLLIGVGLAQLAERLDNTIDDDEELRQGFGLEVLSHIPYDGKVSRGPDVFSVTTGRREALHGLRTALRYIDVDNPPRAILVTSCRPGDGKTTTSASLAAVAADHGQNVVLVEGDLRRPRLRRYAGGPLDLPGIAEVLSEDRNFVDVVTPIEREDAASGAGKLDLLSAGALVPNAAELLGSRRMQALLDELKDAYDLVVVDTAPVLPVTDAVVLSTIVDGVLLVIEPGKTTRHELARAQALFAQVDARVLGVVANKTSAKKPYGYGYGYVGT
jgi:capsular exopolysaccharide synthesis family protein